MAKKERPKDEPTQQTEHGATIPLPTREDVFRDLERVAKTRKANGGSPNTKD